ncbi:YbbR-like domain-containing protein [uncultured Faecalibaculum sp.]|uniref:CdaR family protein n=1 Tax=uncultured Faecalibaculum sp. TaxID=1729681 RepID=UPI00262EE9B5|nr:CdaR family protein [uncultured Faecalibaculum sp.]
MSEKKRVSGFMRWVRRFCKTAVNWISKLFDQIVYNRKASLAVSIMTAVALCISVNFDDLSAMFVNGSQTTLNVSGIPVDVRINEEEYKVEGLPNTADLTVTGTPADIQVFRSQQSNVVVTANLTSFGPGRNEVPLTVSGVPDSLSVTVNPESCSINIIQKQTRTFHIKPELLLGTGQKASDFQTPVLDQTKVKITAAPNELNAIRTVKALVDASGQSQDFTANAVIAAYNANGDKISVTMQPQTVTATVKAAQKEENSNG